MGTDSDRGYPWVSWPPLSTLGGVLPIFHKCKEENAVREPFPGMPGSTGGAWHRNGARREQSCGSCVAQVDISSLRYPPPFPHSQQPNAGTGRMGKEKKEKKNKKLSISQHPWNDPCLEGCMWVSELQGTTSPSRFHLSLVIPEHLPEGMVGKGCPVCQGSCVRPK